MTTLDITSEVRTSSRSSSRTAARIAVAGAAGWVVSIALGTVVAPPEYDTIRDTISVLAAVDNPHAWIVQAGFLSMAVSLAAALFGLWRARYLSARVAASFLAVAAVAMVVAGLNQIACNPALPDCEQLLENNAPRASVIHGRAALFVFLPLLLSGLALARARWRDRGARIGLLVLAVALADIALVFLAENRAENAGAYSGLFQRVFTLGSMGLPVLTMLALQNRSTSQWKRNDAAGNVNATPAVVAWKVRRN
jgi:uncharacterized membrane protein YhaH (DUF805 family)